MFRYSLPGAWLGKHYSVDINIHMTNQPTDQQWNLVAHPSWRTGDDMAA